MDGWRMSGRIIGLHDWFQTPPGRYLLAWEQAQLDATVADIFGYHALQLGLPELNALHTNRMPHQWLANSSEFDASPTNLQKPQRAALMTDFAALPFPANSLDLIVLPHTLEFHGEPHAALREVERVLVPEGRVVIIGFNPASLWGLRQRRAHLYQSMGVGELFLPSAGEFIGYRRMRDWLRLLSFEVEIGRFGCYRAAVRGEKWLNRLAWMDKAGARWWPIFGAVYFLVAVKRVRGMRLLSPTWKSMPSRAGAPVTVTGSLFQSTSHKSTDQEEKLD
jgi:SAM-dependent methyltransferase